MSEKLPILSGKELIKILAKVGFVPTRQSRGSHIFLRHPHGRTTVVPLHDEISKRLLSGILAEIKISGEEFTSQSEESLKDSPGTDIRPKTVPAPHLIGSYSYLRFRFPVRVITFLKSVLGAIDLLCLPAR